MSLDKYKVTSSFAKYYDLFYNNNGKQYNIKLIDDDNWYVGVPTVTATSVSTVDANGCYIGLDNIKFTFECCSNTYQIPFNMLSDALPVLDTVAHHSR